MKRNLGISAALTACLLLGVTTAIPAGATLIALQSTIDGAQANAGAGTGSSATGSAAMIFNDVTNNFSWNITWSGLLGSLTVAHFHGPAGPGMNAGVQVNFGAISGLTSPSIGNAIISNAQAADLLAGLWYINIHTTRDPGGEIRGQVQIAPDRVPEPSVITLILIALAGLVYTHQRRLRTAIAG